MVANNTQMSSSQPLVTTTPDASSQGRVPLPFSAGPGGGRAIEPQVPDPQWLDSMLVPSLRAAKGYHLDVSQSAVKLDQNECPWDVPASVKARVCERLLSVSWNRYPSAFSDELCARLAHHAGVSEGAILLGPGSNYLLSLLLTTFTKHIVHPATAQTGSKLWLARPSFPHCEAHCAYEGIPFVPWNLTADLEYDGGALQTLTPGSVVIFATPNNPVGNSLGSDELALLLQAHPETLFIADEAYYEFTDRPLTPLLSQFSNLILVRTFSKTMASASIRVGYLVASSTVIRELRKLRPPFMLNALQNIAIDEMLQSPEMVAHVQKVVEHTKKERKRLFAWFQVHESSWGMSTKLTEANFFLLRWQRPEAAHEVYQHLLRRGIQVRNVSMAPGLAGCLRMTLGTVEENDAFCEVMASWRPTTVMERGAE